MLAMRVVNLILSASLFAGVVAQTPAQPPQTRTKSRVTKRKPTPKKVVKKPAKVVTTKHIDPLNVPMAGTWFLLDSNEKYVKSTKMVFTKFGEFDFMGSAWRSKGKFTLRNNTLNLIWTQVDGKTVAANTMKKSIPVEEGVTRFQIDRFRYGIYRVSQ